MGSKDKVRFFIITTQRTPLWPFPAPFVKTTKFLSVVIRRGRDLFPVPPLGGLLQSRDRGVGLFIW